MGFPVQRIQLLVLCCISFPMLFILMLSHYLPSSPYMTPQIVIVIDREHVQLCNFR